jgi:DNA-binding winged helix-turn-helix (wHTH) protein/tetratricopeptide (TPR) repeat protein
MTRRLLQFATFTLDLDRLSLIGPSVKTKLRPKSFEVLRYLVEHPGRVIGKEEFIEAIWPQVFVTDESLFRCLSEVRRAIGDEDQIIIKTVPRRGYLLDVPVSAASVQAETTIPTSNRTTSLGDLQPKSGSPDSAASVAERKQVSVLYADLRESLERIAEHDSEEALKVCETTLTLMTQAIRRYGGTVNIETDAAVMGIFGAPVAQEDHALRACYAALQLQTNVMQYSERLQHSVALQVAVRVGLNSGEAVIRSSTEQTGSAYRVIGQTANLAFRLSQLAVPGTSVISAVTLRLAESHIEAKVLNLEKANLLANTAYELVGAGPARTRFQALVERGLTHFVGRSAEMEHLGRALGRADRRHGQVVAIIGEPGVGKSRLVHEFIRANHPSRWRLLETASASYRTTASYQPVIDLLKIYFEIQDRDDMGEVRNKVMHRLPSFGQGLAPRFIPALLALLDVHVDDPLWWTLDPSQRRQCTLDTLKHLILSEARQQPLILVFEDLHWIDCESQAFLETLIDSLASAPLLLLLTYRPEYEHRWGHKSYYTQLRLDVLSPEDNDQFLRHLVGTDVSLGRLREMLSKQGNPFFLEESIRSLVEAKVLVGERGRYRLILPFQEVRCPMSVQAILGSRIDRLSMHPKQILLAASTVGSDIPYGVIQRIVGLEEGELRHSLKELQESEFLYETKLFPDVEYTFKHELTREVAYESLLVEERKNLHGRIVEVIEKLYANRLAEQAERLAHHAVRAELWQKAVYYLRQAGSRAEARCAVWDARAWYEQALSALDKLPESRFSLEQGVEIRLELRNVLIRLGEAQQLLDRLREAEVLAKMLADDRRIAQVYAFITNAHLLCGAPQEALATGVRALEMAERISDLRLRLSATTFLEQAHYHLADYGSSARLATENLAALPSEWTYECLCGTIAAAIFDRFFLIASLAELGQFADAVTHQLEAIQLVRAIEHAHTTAVAHEASGILYLIMGDWEKVLSVVESGIIVAREGGIIGQNSFLVALSAVTLAELDEGELALKRMYESEKLFEVQRQRAYFGRLGWGYCLLGRAAIRLGQISESKRFSDLALELSRHHPGFAARALQLLGDIEAYSNQLDDSERYYHRALALCEPRGMRPLVAECHRRLAKTYERTGHRKKSQMHMTAAESTCHSIK